MNHRKKTTLLPMLRGRQIALGLMFVVAAVITISLACYFHHPAAALCLLGLPLLCDVTALSEADFQKKVIGGLEDVDKRTAEFKTNQEKLLTSVDNLDKETKKAFQELESVKKNANDTSAVLEKLQKAQKALALQAQRDFGDPVMRIAENEEFRARINLAVRLLCNQGTELNAAIEPLKKAVGEESGFGTGYITPELAKEIYGLISQYGIWRQFYVENIGVRAAQIPVDLTDPIAYALSEGTQIPDDGNITGLTITLNVKIIAVLVNVYRTLLEDSQYDVTGRVMRKFSNAFSKRMDYFALAATGADDTTNGKYTGIFSGGVQVAAAAGNTSFAGLQYDDILKLLWSVSAQVLHKKPRFFAHPFVLARLMGVKDKNGRPIFLSYLEAPQFGAMGSILGYPVTMADIAPSTDGAGKPVLSFGDPEGGYFALRSDFNFESSDHFKWDYYARSFRGVGRAGFCIRTDVGVANSANTTIPFATLNTAAV